MMGKITPFDAKYCAHCAFQAHYQEDMAIEYLARAAAALQQAHTQ
jgi:hypothetical protein